jgi:NAD(P)-dependent dehydrogenase (short-subunit alcohol dehydrogenase family)
VLLLRSTEMPLETIKDYGELFLQGDVTLAQRRALLETHAKNVKARMAELQESLGVIQKKMRYYKKLEKKAGRRMKTALVTGTSSGIGLSTAIELAKAGFAVTATMRDTAKSETLMAKAKAEGVTVGVAQLDVQDDTSVKNAVAAFMQKHGQIDVLVNNAGAGYLGTLEQTLIEDAQRVMDVNFFGVWRVTQAVLPHMREAKSGRIISVSSIGAYCAAKFALEGAMEALAPVAKQLGIHVSVIEPGPVNTEFVANVGGLLKRQPSADDPYLPLLQAYMNFVQKSFTGGQTPDEVAKVILGAATSEAPHLRYVTSETVRQRASLKYVDLTGDSVIAAMSKIFV